MDVVLVDHPGLSDYRFLGGHPLKPERFTLAISLMDQWGLLEKTPPIKPADPAARVLVTERASEDDLSLVHDVEYVAAVRDAQELAPSEGMRFGLGSGDTPVFPRMHEAASLVSGASIAALDAVLDGIARRAHNPAGGLHHAQRGHASGFCVYNDAAVAIARALVSRPDLRVAYVDIDAHHGDGVEAAFVSDPRVLTISVHESGRFLFPGTGGTSDVGLGAGEGFAMNAPLFPHSGPESYAMVVEELIRPALERFCPDVLVAQLGADSHRNDPLTHLENSVASFDATVDELVRVADDVCHGRMVALGGGGYDTFSAVPRMWACVMSRLLGRTPPSVLPDEWIEDARERAAEEGLEWHPVDATFDEHLKDLPHAVTQELRRETETLVLRLRNTHPLFARTA